MEKFKGTPGPWKAKKRYDKKYSQPVLDINSGRVKGLCTIWTGQNKGEKINQEFKSNTKLIAAAPELLEALNKILSNFKSCIAGGNGELESDKADIEFAEKAIKKATEL